MATREEFVRMLCALTDALDYHDLVDHAQFTAPILAAWDAQASELEIERMRLAACGVVAMADTPESAARARDMLPEYRSASCDDVARMVDTNMALRAEAALMRVHLVARGRAGPSIACVWDWSMITREDARAFRGNGRTVTLDSVTCAECLAVIDRAQRADAARDAHVTKLRT